MGGFEPRNKAKTDLTTKNTENTKKSGEFKPQMNSDGRRWGKLGGENLNHEIHQIHEPKSYSLFMYFAYFVV
jgi:hypothetical protein